MADFRLPLYIQQGKLFPESYDIFKAKNTNLTDIFLFLLHAGPTSHRTSITRINHSNEKTTRHKIQENSK